MKRLRFLTLIAVFTALFTGCEEPVEVIYPSNGSGNSGTVVDYTKFQCLQTLEGHSSNIFSVAYSPDGTKIVSGAEDNTIKIWNA
ncbi:MAG: WD40 repeat domain-containing protein, partial [Bacteroidales bacterium]|nr:WD40 repeat domain-containing protein [Bacteroidales bacterium]